MEQRLRSGYTTGTCAAAGGAAPPGSGPPVRRAARPPPWGCRGSFPYSPSLQKIYLTWTPLQVVSYF